MTTPEPPSTGAKDAPAAGITIYCDGLCEPNPGGIACWAWLAVDAFGRELAYDCGCLGRGDGMTNNVAEYHALLEALQYAHAHDWRGVRLCSDSQLVVFQCADRWQVGAPALIPLHAEAQRQGRELQACIRWIPREQNGRADILTRQAWRQARERKAAA